MPSNDLEDRAAENAFHGESEVQGTMIHFYRAQALMEKENYLQVVKYLGYCIYPFLKEGHEDEYISHVDLWALPCIIWICPIVQRHIW